MRETLLAAYNGLSPAAQRLVRLLDALPVDHLSEADIICLAAPPPQHAPDAPPAPSHLPRPLRRRAAQRGRGP
ncbi:hypothetical protein JOF41_000892 [Saccharothrix coeruleofusca]|uniref:hypothetical protein n=1 Tax=Saccharothrix coeruleofusca TaxID=33919 RepID=UPI001AE7CBD7|nr:hypothetical protein [Saccharothrix coeruleofusca]MBP2334714.1 hypothetical protein [Saccharothrix coeruleofusca]